MCCPTDFTASVTMAFSPMPTGPTTLHWPAGSSAYPTRARRAGRAMTPKMIAKTQSGMLVLAAVSAKRDRAKVFPAREQVSARDAIGCFAPSGTADNEKPAQIALSGSDKVFCREAVGGFQILAGAAITRSRYARRRQKCPKRHENEKCLPAERRRLAPPSAQGREAFSAFLCAIKSLTLLPQIAPWYYVHEIFSRHDVSRPAERRRFRATLMRRSGAFSALFCATKSFTL